MTEIERIEDFFGKEFIRKKWVNYGMYDTAFFIGSSPWVIRYMAQKYKWIRPLESVPHLHKAVIAGTVSVKKYKNLKLQSEIDAEE